MVVVPEAVRNGVCALYALYFLQTREPGGLTLTLLAGVLARAACAALAVPAFVHLCHNTLFKEEHLPAGMQLCPPALESALEAYMHSLTLLKSYTAPEPLIAFLPLLGIHVSVAALAAYLGVHSVAVAANMMLISVAAVIAVQVVARMHVSTATSLHMLEKRLGVSSHSRVGLGAQLSGAVSEHDVLRVASEALHALFPGATAQAVGTLTEGSPGRVGILEVAAEEETEHAALHNALPRSLPLARDEDDAGNELLGFMVADGPGGDTSVAFVCGHAPERGAVVADSTDWPEGVHAFSDWAAAEQAGCKGGQFVTARIVSGALTVGFVVLHFPSTRSFAQVGASAADTLRDFCEALGDAIVQRRAKDAAEVMQRVSMEKERQAMSLSSIARDIYPQVRRAPHARASHAR